MDNTITCCFTGHRPMKLPWGMRETDDRCLLLKQRIYDAVCDLYSKGYRNYICGMAIGCDTYFAESVLKLKKLHDDVMLEAAVPCATQSSRWNKKQKAHYEELISCCDKVTVFQDEYSPECMAVRNRYMVDNSSCLMACFDGRPGGTMSTIAYASRLGLEIILCEIPEHINY